MSAVEPGKAGPASRGSVPAAPATADPRARATHALHLS